MVEFGDCSRSESVAARLVSGELLGIHEKRVEACASAPGGGCRTRGSGTDDEYIGVGGRHTSIVPSGPHLREFRVVLDGLGGAAREGIGHGARIHEVLGDRSPGNL